MAPLVILKELVDNAIDACEESGVAPLVAVTVDDDGITVSDNGPGLPAETIADVLDFRVRVSSRQAYVSPTRGAQGNALKTVVAMPFVLDGEHGRVEIEAKGTLHIIDFAVDRIRQEPAIEHHTEPAGSRNGTTVRVRWPNLPCSILTGSHEHFLQIASDYGWLNPHLTMTVEWFGEQVVIEATDPKWAKWKPSDPTSAHWFTTGHLERLVSAYIRHDADHGRDRTVRELVAEFRRFSGSTRQKCVLDDTGLHRQPLSRLVNGKGLDTGTVDRLLAAMKAHSKPVKPSALGVIGKEHFSRRFAGAGCEMASFDYRKVVDTTNGVPWVVETAFGWCPAASARRLITGVNWSPGIVNPFRELGRFGQSLDTILSQQRSGRDEPVILVLHMTCPRVEYTDRGKSAVVVAS